SSVFFSSRRRHTISKRDWSSDVCSSDLGEDEHPPGDVGEGGQSDAHPQQRHLPGVADALAAEEAVGGGAVDEVRAAGTARAGGEIGRASCRERGEREVVYV